MCLGIPMRVLETDGVTALCEWQGTQRRVGVLLVEEVAPGEHLLVHMGNAVRLLDGVEAAQITEALLAIEAAEAGGSLDGYLSDLDRAPGLPPRLRDPRP